MIMYPSLRNTIQDIQITINGTETIIPSDFYMRLPYDFNQPVIIGNKITNCAGMFYDCESFNYPITIPNNVIDCYHMFFACRNFNQSIAIPNNVINCRNMFEHCKNFNQPITIPDNTIYCSGMFFACGKFNQPIIIPNKVTNCSEMFYACYSFSNNIYFKTKSTSLDVTYLLGDCDNSKKKNIFFNSVLNSKFNVTSYSSIVASPVTWTPMTKGFYNAAFNVYCYYDYVP